MDCGGSKPPLRATAMPKQRSAPDVLWNGSIRRQSRRLRIGAASRLRGFEATFGCFWQRRFWQHSRSRRNMLCSAVETGVRHADGRSKTAVVTGSYDSAVIGDRFRLARAPTMLTRTASVAPIGFTRLRSERTGGLRAKDVPYEAAFALHVILRPIRVDMWVEGKKIPRASSPPGAAFLFSLSRNPVPEFHTSFTGCGANAGDRRKKALGSLTRITRQALHSKSQARFCF